MELNKVALGAKVVDLSELANQKGLFGFSKPKPGSVEEIE